MAKHSSKDKGVSLAKGPVGITGIILLALGVLGFILGGDEARMFGGISIPDGTIEGGTFLGFEANGWTNLLLLGAGALLLFGAPLHWAAKSLSLIVGLVLGAASVIALLDGDDVLGILAANGPTKLLLGAAAGLLIVLSLLPRVGGGKKDRDHGHIEPRRDRVAEREPARTTTGRSTGDESDYERGLRDAQAGNGRSDAGGTGARSPR